MNELVTLPATLVEKLGWVLLHSVWQFTLCALLLVAVERFSKRTTAATKYLASFAVLTLMVAAAGVTFILAGPEWSHPSITEGVFPRGGGEQFVSGSSTDLIGDSVGSTSESELASLEWLSSAVIRDRGIESADGNALLAEISRDRLMAVVKPWLPVCVLLWTVGVACAAMRLLAGGLHIHRLRRKGLQPVSSEIARILDEAAARLHLRVPVRIMQSSLVAGPVVVGWLRPLILLPVNVVTGLSCDQLAAVLTHELAHVRRRDYLFNLLQTIVETIFFYHPAVWWVSHRVRAHREDCCDDLAIASVAGPVTYASALLALHEGSTAAPALAATGGKLTHRIHRILGLHAATRSSWWGAALMTSLVLLVAGCSLLAFEDRAISAEDRSTVAAEPEDEGESEEGSGADLPTRVPLPAANSPDERESILKRLESLGVSRSSSLDIPPTAQAGASPYRARLWNISDAAWPLLGRFPSIQHLELTGSRVSPEAFRHILGMKWLRKLIVVNSRFEPQHLETLADLKELRELDVMLTVLELKSEERIRQLGKLTPEESRTFVEVAGLDRRLSHIAEATVLTDRALARLARLVKLERLKLINTYASPTGILALRNMRNLKELEFACRPTLTRETTRIFDEMKELEEFSLTGNLAPAAASGLKNLPALSRVSVFGVTDEVATALAEVPSLTKLSLWSNELSDDGLKELARLEKLEQLDIRHAHHGTFTLEGIALFQKSRPDCAVQHSLKVEALVERPIRVSSDMFVTGFYWRGATTQNRLADHVEKRFGENAYWQEFQPLTRKGYIGGVALLQGKAGQAWLQKQIGKDENYEVAFSEPLTARRLRDEGILFATLEKAPAGLSDAVDKSAPLENVSSRQIAALKGRRLPPFPVLLESLRESGQNDTARFLEKRFEIESRYVSRNPRSIIAYGRVVAPPGESARLCNAQMTIHPSGWFVAGIGDKDRPVGFRMFGCRAVDIVPSRLVPGLRPGETASLGRIVMEQFPASELSTIRGRLKLAGESPYGAVRIRAIIQGARTNSISGGTDGFIPWPDKENVTLAQDLQFEHRALAPLQHRLQIEVPGHRVIFRDLNLTAGGTLDLGTIEVPAAPKFQIEFLASMTTDFRDSQLRTDTVQLDERWRSNPENAALARYPSGDMSIRIGATRRINGRQISDAVLLMSGVASLKLADLGQSDLTSFRRKLKQPERLKSNRDIPLKSGHVYLTYHTHWKHWTLLRVTFAAP